MPVAGEVHASSRSAGDVDVVEGCVSAVVGAEVGFGGEEAAAVVAAAEAGGEGFVWAAGAGWRRGVGVHEGVVSVGEDGADVALEGVDVHAVAHGVV